jgi:hypothetical protein
MDTLLESTDARKYTTAKEHVDIIYRLGRMSDEEHAGSLLPSQAGKRRTFK